MTEKERAALIRKGNQFFNEGKLTEAEKIFVATKYKDGLTRIADYFYFDKKMPLFAFKYYKMAGCQNRINEIFERMVFALNSMLHQDDKDTDASKDKNKDSSTNKDQDVENNSPFKIKLEPIKVPPKLKLFAEEILREKHNKE